MKKVLIIFFILVPSLLLAGECFEDFSWKPNTDAITGYNIWYGVAPGVYTKIIDMGKPFIQADGRVHGRIRELNCGASYYFICTAYNETTESAHSNEVYIEFVGESDRPSAPQDFRIED